MKLVRDIRALWQSMKYYIVTSHGISSAISTSTDTYRLYGVGQGATDAPSGWLFVSAILS